MLVGTKGSDDIGAKLAIPFEPMVDVITDAVPSRLDQGLNGE